MHCHIEGEAEKAHWKCPPKEEACYPAADGQQPEAQAELAGSCCILMLRWRMLSRADCAALLAVIQQWLIICTSQNAIREQMET